jgi:hypothetical protein
MYREVVVNSRYNVSPIHLQALLGVRNFTKMIPVCADCQNV